MRKKTLKFIIKDIYIYIFILFFSEFKTCIYIYIIGPFIKIQMTPNVPMLVHDLIFLY